ncbi:MAG: alpha/beta fold hydrolase [Flavobacteriaceae bacterium]|nr:alpha/beta fold hydrolase [Flavobacteriaceae bacterium]
MSTIQHIEIPNYTTEKGRTYISLSLSYQVFGKASNAAPIVLVNHALTGNSNVTGENGWWNSIIGTNKLIDTNKYSVIAFNIPGNGVDDYLIKSYADFTARDIAAIFKIGLDILNIKKLYAVIGGSIGGGIAWELAALYPDLIENLIPIATDWKATDWLIANTKVQELILNNSSNPVHDARVHAMNLYRTPESYNAKFNRGLDQNTNTPNVESWLLHHGKKLQERFQLSSYKLVNHLLSTIDITRDRGTFLEVASLIKSNIFIIGINSDLFFPVKENNDTFLSLSKVKKNVHYGEIKSIHGHDAFLIEFEQLETLLQNVFTQQQTA